MKHKTLRSDRWWRFLGLVNLAVAVLNIYWGYWLGAFTPAVAGMLFFQLPRLLDSQHAMGWTAAANKADDLLAAAARYDAEEQALVPLVPDLLRMQLYVDLMDAKPARREYEQRMNAMMRELAHMKDPTKEQIAELYRRYHR